FNPVMAQAATKVAVFPCPCGTFALRRCPRGAASAASLVLVQNGSMETRQQVSIPPPTPGALRPLAATAWSGRAACTWNVARLQLSRCNHPLYVTAEGRQSLPAGRATILLRLE